VIPLFNYKLKCTRGASCAALPGIGAKSARCGVVLQDSAGWYLKGNFLVEMATTSTRGGLQVCEICELACK
jgi:hypothetical protein